MRLRELAAALELPLEGDPELEITGLAGLRDAGPHELSFVAGPRYAKELEASKAGVVLAPPDLEIAGRPCLRAPEPYVEFTRAIELFAPRPRPARGVHATAVVADDAVLGEDVSIGPYCVIGAGARIGDRTCLYPHVTVYAGVRVGQDCVLHSGVHLRDQVVLGDRCVIQSGAVIGGEGFGFAFRADGTRIRVPHRCPVELGDDCQVGANTTIDASHHAHERRGHADVRTRVADGVTIDNLVQVGHGVSIGAGSSLSSLVGLSGRVELGSGVLVAGHSGVADAVRVGDGAHIGAKTGVTSDVEAGAEVLGFPHMERRLFARVNAALKRLPDLLRRVRALEKKLSIDDGE